MMDGKKYVESIMSFPVCNHTQGVSENNIGYVSGLIEGGIPFEAEVFQYGKGDELQKEISVLLPVMYKEGSRPESIEGNQEIIVGFEYEVSISDLSVLTIGMVEHGQELDADVVRQYVEFLESNDIIRFTGRVQSGSVFYFTDVNGNDFAQVHVRLITCGRQEAITSLQFRSFPLKTADKKDRRNFNVVR